jgi:photosystem II stability/assembly factor-like uncharacterized protein
MTRRLTPALIVVCLAVLSLGSNAFAAATAPPGDQSLLGAWKPQNSHTVTELTGVFFEDRLNGWLIGGEQVNGGGGLNGLTVVRHTADGGENWFEDTGAKNAETLAAGHELKRAFAIGSDVWIIGEPSDNGACDQTTAANTPSDQSIILHSGDGGLNWTRQASGTCEDPESIQMFDQQHGLIAFTCFTAECNNNAFYLQTSNGGNTWTPRTFAAAGAPANCTSVADSMVFPPTGKPFNQREGWLADDCILHTTDGGQTWAEQTVNGLSGAAGGPNTGFSFEQVYGSDTTSLLAVGGTLPGDAPTQRAVAKYNAASGTWTSQVVVGDETSGQHLGVAAVDGRWYVMGESPCCDESMTMFVSTGNGANWGQINPPGGSDQISSGGVFTLDSKHAWAVGQAGTVTAYRNEPGPTATTGGAQATQHTATLSATVNPQGNPTTYSFEWGPTTDYGNQTKPQSAGSAFADGAVSVPLSTLNLGGTYHYRIVATNSFGTATGEDQTFSTVGRSSPMLTLNPISRNKKRPARLVLTGKLALPAGVSPAEACNGQVDLRVKEGKTLVYTGRATVLSNCTFSAVAAVRKAVTPKSRKASDAKKRKKAKTKPGKLAVSAEFLGNGALAPALAAPMTVRFG